MNNDKKGGIFALIVGGAVVVAIIFMMLASKTDDPTFGMIGMGLFVLTVVGAIIASNALKLNTKQQNKPMDSAAKATAKYQPLLMDERTKQDPDVQRLLQYYSVQKVFFDPNYLSTEAAQNDIEIRELLAVLDRMLGSGEVNGDFAQYPSTGSFSDPNSAYLSETKRPGIGQRERRNNSPRRKVGRILKYVGLGIFFIPFVIMFLFPTGVKNGTTAAYFFMAAPFGMIMAAIGSKIR